MRCCEENFSVHNDWLGEFDAEAWRVRGVLCARVEQVRDVGCVISAQDRGRGRRSNRILNRMAVVKHPQDSVGGPVCGDEGSSSIAEGRNAFSGSSAGSEVSGVQGKLLDRAGIVAYK